MYRAYLPKALALTLLTASLGIAGAQQAAPAPDATAPQANGEFHHRHAPNPERQAAMLAKRLNLTPDQTAKVEPILAARDQQMQSLRQNQQLAPEDRRQQMRSINQQTEQQMAGVLSPDQLAQLKTMRHHHGRHHQDGGPAENGQSPS